MSQLNQQSQSVWQKDSRSAFPPLDIHTTTDVCIIGAGISGMSCAYQLLKKGLQVVVIDKEDFGNNETGFSTAHISNALDDRYSQLNKWLGERGGQLAYESHTAAISQIEKTIAEENIECDFARVDGFLFLASEHLGDYLEEEMKAAHQVGFKEVALLDRAPNTFFETGLCLKFPRQAQFHPLKYLKGLCKAVQKLGGRIYNQTKATEVSGGPLACVETSTGFQVSCQHIIVATNVPINDLMTIHTKEAAYRTYAMALRLPKLETLQLKQSLFWDTGDPYHFIRTQRLADKKYDLLIVGGEDHRVGQLHNPQQQYDKLQHWTRRRLSINAEVLYRWSGQIIEPIDGMAYIGRNPGNDENIYIACGDSGQGITHGTIAGMILSDLISGTANPWVDLYKPSRFRWKCLDTFAQENIQGLTQLKDWLKPGEIRYREELRPGQGAVITKGLAKHAVYRDENGNFHEFSAACPHLRGVVRWNPSEQTWDCPFHGSRFNKMGEVLNGPAMGDLERVRGPLENNFDEHAPL